MVVVEARRFTLPNPSLLYSIPPPHVTSFLFDPVSLSLALQHSDTSFSLYPCFSPLSLSSLPPPSIVIPAPTSSAAFVHLHHLSNPNPNSIFLTCSPFLGGTAVMLRFYIFNPSRKAFSKLKLRSGHRDLRVDESTFGVVFAVSHGVSVRLEGGSNVFAMYSVSNSKIWVFAVKMEADFEEAKLMKCAVIDCVLPVFSISVKFGHLILGEENGVRVFPLRPLLKGKVKKEDRGSSRRNLNVGLEKNASKLQNGLNLGRNGIELSVYPSKHGGKFLAAAEATLNVVSNGGAEGKAEKHSDYVKLRTMKLRQETKEWGKCFLTFKSAEAESLKSTRIPVKPPKAMSIQALSPSKFLVLDSTGALHLIFLSSSVCGSEPPYHVKRLTQTMKVCKLAVLPGSQAVWISDGQYTVHVLVLADEETSSSEPDEKEITRAIFSSEKIQEIVPLAVDALLILGQGSMFAYAVS